jgi:hypothetical protein
MRTLLTTVILLLALNLSSQTYRVETARIVTNGKEINLDDLNGLLIRDDRIIDFYYSDVRAKYEITKVREVYYDRIEYEVYNYSKEEYQVLQVIYHNKGYLTYTFITDRDNMIVFLCKE